MRPTLSISDFLFGCWHRWLSFPLNQGSVVQLRRGKGPYIVEAVCSLDDILRRMENHQAKKSVRGGGAYECICQLACSDRD